MRRQSRRLYGRGRSAAALVALVLLSACTSLPEQESRPARRIGEAVILPAPAPAEPKLSVDDLLAMAKRGVKSEATIARFEASGARFDLTPTQVVDLHARGLPLPVLEAIHTARERALNNDYAQKLVDLDRKCSADLQRERRVQRCPDPYWGRPGVWGGYPPRGGVYWGW